MSILFQILPDKIQVGNVEYPINADYRCMARFEQRLMTSDRGNKRVIAEIFAEALKDFYKGNIPTDMSEAIDKMWWFYRCGEDISSRANQAGTKHNKRLYDYDVDGGIIAAAFMDTFGIDIISNTLHWWLFRSYFSELGENTRIVKIMSYRGADLTEYKGKQRKIYANLKKAYELPEVHQTPLTPEERDAEFKRRMIERRNKVLSQQG